MTDDDNENTTDGDSGIGLEIPSVTTYEPTTADEFTHRDHYPDETAEQWDNIRRGKFLYIDNEGHEVESRQEADRVLFPDTGARWAGSDGHPPITSLPVGRPDGVGDRSLVEDDFKRHHFAWASRDDCHLMVADEEKIIDWTDHEVVEWLFEDDSEGDNAE